LTADRQKVLKRTRASIAKCKRDTDWHCD
jgi:hypothetical protein